MKLSVAKTPGLWIPASSGLQADLVDAYMSRACDITRSKRKHRKFTNFNYS